MARIVNILNGAYQQPTTPQQHGEVGVLRVRQWIEALDPLTDFVSMADYGDATGVVLGFDPVNGAGKILGLYTGELQAYFDTDGKIKAGGGQVILQKAGLELRHDTTLTESGYGIGGYGIGGYGGVTTPLLVFTRTSSAYRYAIFKTTADELVVGFSPNAGADGYAVRWKFTNDGACQWPVLAGAPLGAEGRFAWADGSGWNPGAGAGPYAYASGGWRKLIGYGN